MDYLEASDKVIWGEKDTFTLTLLKLKFPQFLQNFFYLLILFLSTNNNMAPTSTLGQVRANNGIDT